MKLFVSGIGTEVGKTVVSSILVKALSADYWKPVQSGDLDYTDTMKVQAWSESPASRFFPEGFRLNTPASPHYSAAVDGIKIELDDFVLPDTDKPLIVEGAGGLHVPLNDKHLIIDLMEKLMLPVVLVSRNYLGSINHTLLSIEALKSRNIPIAGIIFNGNPVPSTESYILSYSQVKYLGRIGEEAEINAATIHKYALQLATQKDYLLGSKI